MNIINQVKEKVDFLLKRKVKIIYSTTNEKDLKKSIEEIATKLSNKSHK